jgi:FlaA1/EpsC-like NDP-sugar epimerase
MVCRMTPLMRPAVENVSSPSMPVIPPEAALAISKIVSLARRLTFNRPHLAVVAATLGIFAAAFVLAYWLRFEFAIPARESSFVISAVPFVLLVKLIVFYLCGTYRILWAYVGIRDLFRLFRATVFASGGIVGVNFLIWRDQMAPRSVVVLDGVLTFLAVGGLYVLLRHLREAGGLPSHGSAEPVVIVGAGDAGEALLRELQRNPLMGARVVGFVDDAPHKQGHSLRGVPVVGRTEDIREIAYRFGVRKAFIAIPNASGLVMRKLVTGLLTAGLAVKVLPQMGRTATSSGFVPQLREVSMEDLLRREPIKLDDQAISAFIKGKVVLVTGAAGSIGSELCRQLLECRPARLVALDCAETPLHNLILELRARVDEGVLIPELADVTHKERIEGVFQKERPAVVFHAAALKHVPMLESHPCEGVRVNVGGTQIVAEAAKRSGTWAFVLISTDKAVRPSSVMGATKRIAEMLIKTLDGGQGTRFMSVRFGNVLGSNGSVLPIFKAQLARGGPITVTHPEMRRYFMTIPEAVQLVLQASVLGRGGETFVLDMGEAVRIVDLAKDLIRLSGLVPDVDVKVEFTGMRPGEKLFEEIRLDSEEVERTSHLQVFLLRPKLEDVRGVQVESEFIFRLLTAKESGEAVSLLGKLVREHTLDA